MNAALEVLGVSSPCVVSVELDAGEHRRVDARRRPIYAPAETVSGTVSVRVKSGRPLAHRGIQIECVGFIDGLRGRRHTRQELLSVGLRCEEADVIPAGEVRRYPFAFVDIDKPYDTYDGINVRLRYAVRVTVQRPQPYHPIVEECDLAVQQATPPPDLNPSIRMEVGIEDVLHIEFEYSHSNFHLKDVVIGKIYFLLVRVKIKRMEIEIRRRENVRGLHSELETVAKYEVMDGAPVRGESIPVRLFLAQYPTLTPTYRSVAGVFTVKYFLNLVMIDEDDRRYWKQHEVFLWRDAKDMA
ncbi:hypothetical protein CDCA_CDCA10G2941 [Cyanidium caldarium]|uniref:Vacuolar protein sorting-associated protein 26 n=1 Tax=Cyanidium caldarium TaxID=2771 RepID=A0AAV9IXP0_CYACA|nr:hypothetical protein CDCA_CDCA10G2941 [Cyanidium caldarium]